MSIYVLEAANSSFFFFFFSIELCYPIMQFELPLMVLWFKDLKLQDLTDPLFIVFVLIHLICLLDSCNCKPLLMYCCLMIFYLRQLLALLR